MNQHPLYKILRTGRRNKRHDIVLEDGTKARIEARGPTMLNLSPADVEMVEELSGVHVVQSTAVHRSHAEVRAATAKKVAPSKPRPKAKPKAKPTTDEPGA